MTQIDAPVAKRELRVNRPRKDPYAWLRDENWQEVLRDPSKLSDDIRDHLKAENLYTDHIMRGTEGLQQDLYAEMRGRVQEEKTNPPLPHDGWLYYKRYVDGGNYPIFCRRLAQQNADGPEEVIFDGNKEALGHEHFALDALKHSPDHALVAYMLDPKFTPQLGHSQFLIISLFRRFPANSNIRESSSACH